MLPVAVRLKFTKVGSLQFISHLDLNRTMKTILLRAKIPIKYSEGFNPHPKMAFAVPLSIGAESVCELIDFKIDKELSYDEIKERMNGALPPEMRVIEAYCPTTKFTDIHYAEYEILSDEILSAEALEKDEIIVSKRTKSGMKDTDIKPLIKSWQRIEGGVKCVLCADSEKFLNPEYIASLLELKDYSIMRTAFLLDDGVTVFR